MKLLQTLTLRKRIQNQIQNIFQIYKQEHLTWNPEKKKNKWHPRPSPHYFHQIKLLQKTLEPLLLVKRVQENGQSNFLGGGATFCLSSRI